MLTPRNIGAVGFPPQQAVFRVGGLASENLIFEISLIIRFVLNYHGVPEDTPQYFESADCVHLKIMENRKLCP